MKHSRIIAAATIMVVIASAAMIAGILGQTSQKALAQTSRKGAAANTTVVTVTPSQSTNKTFWIDTVHVDGTTNIHTAVACDTCSQNTPLHPAKFPNTTLTTGPGMVLRPPNKVGAWDFRAFAFDPSMIVINQGDKVSLHFVGVQGFRNHHPFS